MLFRYRTTSSSVHTRSEHVTSATSALDRNKFLNGSIKRIKVQVHIIDNFDRIDQRAHINTSPLCRRIRCRSRRRSARHDWFNTHRSRIRTQPTNASLRVARPSVRIARIRPSWAEHRLVFLSRYRWQHVASCRLWHVSNLARAQVRRRRRLCSRCGKAEAATGGVVTRCYGDAKSLAERYLCLLTRDGRIVTGWEARQTGRRARCRCGSAARGSISTRVAGVLFHCTRAQRVERGSGGADIYLWGATIRNGRLHVRRLPARVAFSRWRSMI